MPTWPDTLPAAPLLESFHETTPDSTIRTEMDAGPAKLRRRTTAAVRRMNVGYLLSKAQVATLEDFYLTTLQGGTIPFTFTHPRTDDAVSCRFVQPPEYGANNGNYFKAALELEVMP